MPSPPLLAQAVAPWSLENIAVLVVAGLLGSGVLISVVVIMVWGYWKKKIAPLILDEVAEWHTRETQRVSRSKEIDDRVLDWHRTEEQQAHRAKELQNMLRDPKVIEEQESRFKRVLDDQIQRKDGLISKEIETQVSDMETRLMAKLNEVATYLMEDSGFKQQIIQRMARLEGAINATLPQGHKVSGSSPNIEVPAHLPPRPDGRKER
jgi:hypothetical protein